MKGRLDLFALGRRWQLQVVLVHRRVPQQRRHDLQRGGRPYLLTTVAASFAVGPIAKVLDVAGITICSVARAALVVTLPVDGWRSLWRAFRIR